MVRALGLTLGGQIHFRGVSEYLALLRSAGFEARVLKIDAGRPAPHRLYICRACLNQSDGEMPRLHCGFGLDDRPVSRRRSGSASGGGSGDLPRLRGRRHRRASILVTGPTFQGAARQARSLGLPTSLHLAVVDTAPISPPSEIPSLVGPDGRFPPFFGAVVRRALLGERLGGLRRSDLRLEIGRQLQAFADAGLSGGRGLQVDGHQHLHLLPAVFDTVLHEGARFPLAAFRLPRRSPHERRQSGPRSLGFVAAELLGRRAAGLAARQGIAADRAGASSRRPADARPGARRPRIAAVPGGGSGDLPSRRRRSGPRRAAPLGVRLGDGALDRADAGSGRGRSVAQTRHRPPSPENHVSIQARTLHAIVGPSLVLRLG